MNGAAVQELSEVLESALKKAYDLGLLGMPLFAVLPNSMDEENLLNISLIQAATRVCCSYPIFKSRIGRIVNRSKIAYGTDNVTKLFPQEIAEPFMEGRYWIKPCEAGSREECFLFSVGVSYYNREYFLKTLFTKENYCALEQLLENQNSKWLRQFYIFCTDPVTENSTRKQIISAFKNTKSIRNVAGEMHFPHEVACVTDILPLSKKSPVIKPEIVSPSGADDQYSDQLRKFFIKELGIKKYTQRSEIEELANSLVNKKQPIDVVYTKKLLTIAAFDEANGGEIDFGSYAIFPYETSKGMRRGTADELVIGKPYIVEGNLLASATGRHPLWNGFAKILNHEELSTILNFAERTGAIGMPRIVKQTADEHRDFYKKLFVSGKQEERDSNYDYTIPGLQEILKKKSKQLSRLVWYVVLDANSDEVLNAEYSVEDRLIVNKCESSLLLTLRERAWVPGKNGKFYKPENIAIDDINEDFAFDGNSPVLRALEFGEGPKKREKALKELSKIAVQEGYRLVAEDEYREFLEWKRNKG